MIELDARAPSPLVLDVHTADTTQINLILFTFLEMILQLVDVGEGHLDDSLFAVLGRLEIAERALLFVLKAENTELAADLVAILACCAVAHNQ